MTCSTCRYWAPDLVFNQSAGGGPKYGKCKRSTPLANAAGNAVWPVTEKSDWCGEYEGAAVKVTVKQPPDNFIMADCVPFTDTTPATQPGSPDEQPGSRPPQGR